MQFDLTLPLLLLLAVGLATCGRAVDAQEIPVEMRDGAPVPEGAFTDAETPGTEELAEIAQQIERVAALAQARLDSLALVRAGEQRRQALADSLRAIELSRPVAYATGYGLAVVLPPGWDGPVQAEESGFPGYALYTFDNARMDRSVPGASVRIERVGALNPLEQERWRRGQSPYGLHGMRPAAARDARLLPLPAQAAIAVEADGRRGLAVYAQRGTVFWAVQVSVPETVYLADPTVLDALLAGLTLP